MTFVMHRILKSAFPWLALMALLLRSFVPLGFMPGVSAGMPMVICTGMGAATIYVSPDKIPAAPSDHSHPQTGKDVCPFASALSQGAPAFAAVLADIALQAFMPAPAFSAFLPMGAVFKPYLAQAPPAFPLL